MFMTKLTRNDLSIIDGWLGKSLTELEINFIFEIVEKRTEVHSTIFCLQYAPQDCYARLGASTQCESILNRISSGLCRLNCGPMNMRNRYSLSKLRIYVVLKLLLAPVLSVRSPVLLRENIQLLSSIAIGNILFKEMYKSPDSLDHVVRSFDLA